MSVRDGDDRWSYDVLRDARGGDLDAVRRLLAEAGLPVAGVEDQLPKAYRVAERDGDLFAVAGCEIHGNVGLLRSLAVRTECRGDGLARRLVEDRLAWARRLGLRAVYLLTMDAASYFERFGFVSVERSETPAEIRASSEFATVCPDSATVMTLPLFRKTSGRCQLEQRRQALRFRALHAGPPILVLPNAWDAISAKLYQAEGFEAVGTTSAGISATLGYPDGQRMSEANNIAVVKRICDRTGLLVSADLEAGYSDSPEKVAENAKDVLEAGAVGLNLEDGTGDQASPLAPIGLVVDKIRAIRETASVAQVPLFINARTDVFLTGVTDTEPLLAETVARATAYREAGADCVFAPDAGGALDAEVIRTLVREIPAPLNILAGEATPSIPELEALGVARVSFGPRAMRAALALLRRIAREWREAGTYSTMFSEALSFAEVKQMLDRSECSA